MVDFVHDYTVPEQRVLLDYYCSVWVSNKICLWYTIPLEYKLIKY